MKVSVFDWMFAEGGKCGNEPKNADCKKYHERDTEIIFKQHFNRLIDESDVSKSHY